MRNPHRCPPSSPRGFTLIEVMVVVLILGLLAALVVPSVWSSADRAKEGKAAADVRVIAGALKQFYIDHATLPTLADLTRPDAKQRVYLDELPLDPWQGEYVLQQQGPTVRETFVASAGPDRVLGTDDDISSRRQ
jgi:general secretion pathway protein G